MFSVVVESVAKPIARAAKATGTDQAQSPTTDMAAAATTQPTSVPTHSFTSRGEACQRLFGPVALESD